MSATVLFGALDSFPGDPSPDVCPTRAIRWDAETAAAFVNSSDCIGCGLCVSRCPYGAIRLADGKAAQVQRALEGDLVIAGPGEGVHPRPDRRGRIAALDAPAAAALPETVAKLEDDRMMLLVRNLLNEIGLNARTRRRGDPNMRIDAAGFSRSGRPFVAEIEMGAEVLESPRALLEDVAILHSRYGYPVSDIDPVSIILAFPNMRSEYYRVIRDIEKVLDLRCRTITLAALVALLWNGTKIDGFTGDAFAIGAGTIDLADCLGADCLGADASRLPEPYPGAFTPAK